MAPSLGAIASEKTFCQSYSRIFKVQPATVVGKLKPSSAQCIRPGVTFKTTVAIAGSSAEAIKTLKTACNTRKIEVKDVQAALAVAEAAYAAMPNIPGTKHYPQTSKLCELTDRLLTCLEFNEVLWPFLLDLNRRFSWVH